MEARTNTRSFCVIVGADPNDTIVPTCVGTDKALAFLPQVLGMDGPTLAFKMRNWACVRETPPKDATQRRTEVVGMMEGNLRMLLPPPAGKLLTGCF